ncbi:MAG: rod shape-determining protein MreD [Anaerolineae bacterium]
MNPYATIGLLVGMALLQTTLVPHLSVAGVKPDLMLMAVVSWSLLRGAGEGIVWGAIGGLILDLLSGGPFGICTLSLILVGYLTGLGEINIFRANILLPGVTVLFATLVYNLALLLLLQILGWPVTWGLNLLRIILPAILWNMVLMPLVYTPLRWLHRATGREEMEI